MRSLLLPAIGLVMAAFACADLGGLSNGAAETSDAGTAEAGPPGSLDGGSDAHAADAGTFCQRFTPDGGATLFCRDFDDGRAADDGWTFLNVNDGGTFALDPDHTSAPSSLRSRLEKTSAPCLYARAGQDVDLTQPHVSVSFDVKLGGTDTVPTDTFAYADLVLTTGANGCRLVFQSGSAGAFVQAQYGNNVNDTFGLSRWPVPGNWSHVELTVDRTARSVNVFVDGRAAFGAPQTLNAGCAISSTFEVQPGIYCEGSPDAPFEVRLDNLLITESP